jgi:tRNA(Arg) A34 adenosine deaminase TadA
MDKLDFMRRAIALSKQGADAGGAPFGAVVVKNGAVVGQGWNTVAADHDPTAHGEVVAIRDACKRLGTIDLSGCDIYTSCEPCSMCVATIWWAKLDRVYYANALDDTRQYFALGELLRDVAQPIGRRSTPSEQLLAGEALAVIKRWVERSPDHPMLQAMPKS